jgi:hypothetical protein
MVIVANVRLGGWSLKRFASTFILRQTDSVAGSVNCRTGTKSTRRRRGSADQF